MSSNFSTNVENESFVIRFIEAMGTKEPAEVQRKLGVSYQAAKNYLHGRMPAADVLVKIAAETDISLHWLLTGEGNKYISLAEMVAFTSDDESEDQDQDQGVNSKQIRVSFSENYFLEHLREMIVEIAHDVARDVARNEIALDKGEKLERSNVKEIGNVELMDVIDGGKLSDEPQIKKRKKA